MSKTITIFHGTSEKFAKQIMKEGFKANINHNWNVKSKGSFVYFSYAYAPFYSMKHDTNKLAIIKVSIECKDLYPEDDFLMRVLGHPIYTQEELNNVNFRMYKKFWKESLEYMGNVACKPNKIKILGVTYFNGEKMLYKCDPVISPMNFKILGEYYKEFTEHIFNGREITSFKSIMGVDKT